MSAGINCYDNERHLERRAAQADTAERQLDVMVGRYMRARAAIEKAAKHLRDINLLKGDRTLAEIADELERANLVREDDK